MLSIEQARDMRQGVTLTGDRNQCAECGQLFNSTAAFDKHRTGTYGESRRCRRLDEMRLCGMAKNNAGFWVTERLSLQQIDDRNIAIAAKERDEIGAAEPSPMQE